MELQHIVDFIKSVKVMAFCDPDLGNFLSLPSSGLQSVLCSDISTIMNKKSVQGHLRATTERATIELFTLRVLSPKSLHTSLVFCWLYHNAYFVCKSEII